MKLSIKVKHIRKTFGKSSNKRGEGAVNELHVYSIPYSYLINNYCN